MLVVSSNAHTNPKQSGQDANFATQTKHAAELCALLVSDLYGELPSVSFRDYSINLLNTHTSLHSVSSSHCSQRAVRLLASFANTHLSLPNRFGMGSVSLYNKTSFTM